MNSSNFRYFVGFFTFDFCSFFNSRRFAKIQVGVYARTVMKLSLSRILYIIEFDANGNMSGVIAFVVRFWVALLIHT